MEFEIIAWSEFRRLLIKKKIVGPPIIHTYKCKGKMGIAQKTDPGGIIGEVENG